MITLWLLYATIVTGGIAAGARAIERLVQAAGGPTRMIWAIALCLAVSGPIAIAAGRSRLARAPEQASKSDRAIGWESVPEPAGITTHGARQTGDTFGAAGPSAEASTLAIAPRRSGPVFRVYPARALPPDWLDALVLRVWGIASLLLAASLVVRAGRTARRRRRWHATMLEETPVYLSDDVGPALVGVLRPRIVLPHWVLGMRPEDRRLVVTHEREHARAADPVMLTMAIAAVVCMPWNAGLWYIRRNLQLAIELDCDRRVLERHPDLRRYCSLLLDVGARALHPPTLSAALTRRKSDLARRVEQLTTPKRRLTALRAAAGVMLCALFVAASCTIPSPPAPSPDSTRSASHPGSERPPVATAPERFAANESVTAQIARQAASLDTVLTGSTPQPNAAGSSTSELSRLLATPADTGLEHLLGTTFDSEARALQIEMMRMEASTPRIRDAIARHFPEALAGGQPATVGLWFLVDAQGAVVRTARSSEARPPTINADVVARQFPGVGAESIEEVRILGGEPLGIGDRWVVWSILKHGASSK